MGPPSYMQSVVDRNAAMRHIPVYLHSFLTSTLDRVLWSALKSELFTPTESAPANSLIGG